MKKFTIELNEKQMQVVKDALELRFRIDLLQEDMLAEILATMNDLDLSPKKPNHELSSPTISEMVSTIPCGIVRHVHSATTPSGKPFGILEMLFSALVAHGN